MDGVAIVVFSDLVDSTRLLVALGDDRMDEVRRAHLQDVERAVTATGGRVVKTLGDGAMASFESAVGALHAAASIQAAVERLDAAQGAVGLAARVGVAAGEPVADGDDLHGMAVVIASRLCAAAPSGEVLVQDLVGALVESRGRVRLGQVSGYELKGLPTPVRAARLHWREMAADAPPGVNVAAQRKPGGWAARSRAGARVSTSAGQQADPLAPHSLSPKELKEVIDAERARAPFLVFRDQQGSLRLMVLADDGRTRTLGRRAEMDLSISWDGEVSGFHAELQCLNGEWLILDDGLSTNGTYVNGQRVAGRQRLRDGDRIRVGRTILAYDAAQPEPTSKTVIAGELPALSQITDTERRV